MTTSAGFAGATAGVAGSRAGCASAGGTAPRSCSRAGSPSCSSSTRQPRTPQGTGPARSADAIDARLHSERLTDGGRAQRHHEGRLERLPDGAFVLIDAAPWLVRGDRLLRYTPAGYTDPRARGRGAAQVITPSLVEVLRTGWDPFVPLLHPSAG